TLRRHMASRHKGIYRTWCKTNSFISMLPEDTKARKADLLQKLEQSQVNEHFPKARPEDKPVPYSDELFKEAAVRWLVETDQPIQAFEHPSFKDMISTAARATRGVNIPGRKQARSHIMKSFRKQMLTLRERLNVSLINTHFD
ncbi:hypothetical protein BJ912DRAFT_869674, partial [Pholiota molesta]